MQEASGKVLELEKQAAKASEAPRNAHQEAAKAGRETARAESAEQEIVSLRAELGGKSSEIGRLEDALVKKGEELEAMASASGDEREAMWALQLRCIREGGGTGEAGCRGQRGSAEC